MRPLSYMDRDYSDGRSLGQSFTPRIESMTAPEPSDAGRSLSTRSQGGGWLRLAPALRLFGWGR